MQIKKAQISLRNHAVWSVPLLFAATYSYIQNFNGGPCGQVVKDANL